MSLTRSDIALSHFLYWNYITTKSFRLIVIFTGVRFYNIWFSKFYKNWNYFVNIPTKQIVALFLLQQKNLSQNFSRVFFYVYKVYFLLQVTFLVIVYILVIFFVLWLWKGSFFLYFKRKFMLFSIFPIPFFEFLQ